MEINLFTSDEGFSFSQGLGWRGWKFYDEERKNYFKLKFADLKFQDIVCEVGWGNSGFQNDKKWQKVGILAPCKLPLNSTFYVRLLSSSRELFFDSNKPCLEKVLASKFSKVLVEGTKFRLVGRTTKVQRFVKVVQMRENHFFMC